MEINLTQHLTTLVTGHGNIKSYLHRFRIMKHETAHVETAVKQQNTHCLNAEYSEKKENA